MQTITYLQKSLELNIPLIEVLTSLPPDKKRKGRSVKKFQDSGKQFVMHEVRGTYCFEW